MKEQSTALFRAWAKTKWSTLTAVGTGPQILAWMCEQRRDGAHSVGYERI